MEALESFNTLPKSDQIHFFRILQSLSEPKKNVADDDSSTSSQNSSINGLLEHLITGPKIIHEENIQPAEPKKKQKTLDCWLIKKGDVSPSKECAVKIPNSNIAADTAAAEQNDNSIPVNSVQDFTSGTLSNVKDARSFNCKGGNVRHMQAEVGGLITCHKTAGLGALSGGEMYNLRSKRKTKSTLHSSEDNIKYKKNTDNNVTCTKVVNIIDRDLKSNKNCGEEFAQLSQDQPLMSSTGNPNKSDFSEINDFQAEQSEDSSVSLNSLNIRDMNKPPYKYTTKKKSLQKLKNENYASLNILDEANESDRVNETESVKKMHLLTPVICAENIPTYNEDDIDSETIRSSKNIVDSGSRGRNIPAVSKVISPRKSKRIKFKKLQNKTEVDHVNACSISNQNAVKELNYSTSSHKNIYFATTESDGTMADKYCSDNSITINKVRKNSRKDKYLQETVNEIEEGSQLSQDLSVESSTEIINHIHSSDVHNCSTTDQSVSDMDVTITSNDTSVLNVDETPYNLQTNKNSSKKLEAKGNNNFATNSTSEFNYEAFCEVKTALCEIGLDIHDILQNENVQNILSNYESNIFNDAVVFVGTHKSVDETILPIVHAHASKTKLLESLCETQKMLSKKK